MSDITKYCLITRFFMLIRPYYSLLISCRRERLKAYYPFFKV